MDRHVSEAHASFHIPVSRREEPACGFLPLPRLRAAQEDAIRGAAGRGGYDDTGVFTGEPMERSETMSLGEIAYEAYHAALQEYRRTHHDQFDPAGRWLSLSPQFQAAWEAASHAVASAVVDRLRDAEE